MQTSGELTWREIRDALWLTSRIGLADPPPSTSRSQENSGVDESPDDGPDTLGPPTDPEPSPGSESGHGEEEGGRLAVVSALLQTPHPGPREAGDLEENEGVRPDPGLTLLPGGSHDPRPSARDHDFVLIARAMRPFRTTVPAPQGVVLNEEATAASIAEDPFWSPITQPERERGWEAVLVVDQHATLDAARPVVEEFRMTLERQGFRDVHLRLLQTGEASRVVVTSAGHDPDLRRPAEVVLAGARRVVFVVTDGSAPAWHSGAAIQALADWGRHHPVAAIHLLPEPRWRLTGLRGRPVSLRSGGPGEANARWGCRARDLTGLRMERDSPGPVAMTPVPVLELDSHWLGSWSRLVMHTTSEWADLAAVMVADEAAPVPMLGSAPGSAPEEVARFRAGVSPSTFRLATYVAAAPLDLNVMQTVQARLLPESEPGNLSEILASSLIRAKDVAEPVAGPVNIRFEFPVGVREELLSSGRSIDIVKVAQTVDEVVGLDHPELHLSTVLASPEQAPALQVSAVTLPWTKLQAQILAAIGGRHLKRARKTDLEIRTWEEGRASASDQYSPAPPSHELSPPTRGPHPVPVKPKGPGVSSTLDDELTGRLEPDLRVRLRRGPSISGNLPNRNANFTGRTEMLEELHRQLQVEGATAAVLPYALHGLGGVGKTHLAVEYIHRFMDNYDLIWWIPAERTARIAASLVDLAQRLDLHAGAEANTAVPAVLEALMRGEPVSNWLLVFDNAERPDLVREYLPHGGKGNILITSRDARWSEVAEPLEVTVFQRDESIRLLQRRGKTLSDEDADRMAEALGDLPLAIDQAAAWYVETGMPAQEYLRLLNEKQAELLAQASFEDQTPVIAAWNVSVDRLEETDPAALQLLQMCSFFAADHIPRTMLTAARNQHTAPGLDKALKDPVRFSRALREITKYSLAKIDHRTTSIQMHRLVQAALIARMSEEQRTKMRHAAHVVLAANDPDDPESPAQFAHYLELYPHLISSGAIDCQDRWTRALVINASKFLYRWGDHEAARRLARDALVKWTESLGVRDPQTLEISKWLGFVLFAVGRYSAAAELNARTLATYDELEAEGAGDSDGRLEAVRNVAIDRSVQGEFEQARALSEQVLEGSDRAFGEDDPATLNAAHNLAVTLRLCGDFAAAKDLDAQTWDRKQQIFGSDHPLTMITRLGLLVDIRELGDYRLALGMNQDALALAQSAFGDINPVTLAARRLVAVAQRKAGQHLLARQTSQRVSAQLVQRYSEEHPEAMAAKSNLAIDLRQTGDLVAARDLGQKSQEIYQRTLGLEHPHTLSANVNLAITYRLLGQLSRARELDTAALQVFTRRLGSDHPNTLVCATSLASDLFLAGEVSQALELDTNTLSRLAGLFGPTHPTTLACATNQALDLDALGRHDEASAAYDEASLSLRQCLGDDHPATTEAMDRSRRANCDIDPMPL